MADWCVYLGAEGGLGAVDAEAAADSLMDLVAEYGGVVAADETGWEATLTQAAPDPVTALLAAVETVPDLAMKAGFPSWPVVRLEVGPYDEEGSGRPSDRNR